MLERARACGCHDRSILVRAGHRSCSDGAFVLVRSAPADRGAPLRPHGRASLCPARVSPAFGIDKMNETDEGANVSGTCRFPGSVRHDGCHGTSVSRDSHHVACRPSCRLTCRWARRLLAPVRMTCARSAARQVSFRSRGRAAWLAICLNIPATVCRGRIGLMEWDRRSGRAAAVRIEAADDAMFRELDAWRYDPPY